MRRPSMRRSLVAVLAPLWLATALLAGACGGDGSPGVAPADASGAPHGDAGDVAGGGEIVFCGWTCERLECGVDGCGEVCGTCAEGEDCLGGACVPACVSDCAGRTCGDDGCGGTCGTCAADQSCAAGVCEAPCAPTCGAAAECGPNGCGGACGDCPAGEQCFGDQCLTDCTPACVARDCGSDGCGGSCGDCAAAESCVAGRCLDCACGARDCGDNGCGGSCGTCPGGEFCVEGACTETCAADCGGRVCGDDGCGGTCGTCAAGAACVAGECTTTCAPDCTDRECGPDGCGGSCGPCGTGEACAGGACDPVCTPDCAGKACGDNGCGGLCGTCAAGAVCLAGACVTDCQPACAGRACGDDGCGGVCGTCGAGQACAGGACVPLCTPDCTGRACGDNGCGGSCGTCGGAEVCTDGACVQPTQLVDWCRFQWPRDATVEVGMALTVYGRVFEAGITDATSGGDADPRLVVAAGVAPDGAQPGSGAFTWAVAAPNAGWNDAPEPGNDEYMAVLFAPLQPGEYDLAFRATVDGGDHWIYCDLQTPSGDGSADGWQSANAARLQAICVSDCGDRRCGADGCGGVCGTCGADETCEDGVCAAVADPVDWCRLQWPLAQTAAPGAAFTAYVRLYEAGVTTASDAVDEDPALVVEGAVGPDGSDPAGGGWSGWAAAAPNPAWDAAEAAEPSNDEYQLDLTAPATVGTHDFAFRASADGGATWTYCDGNGGFGHDGSEDGYQPERAGALTVACVPDCDERACGPDPVCGESCGDCGPDEGCDAEGACVALPDFGWCRVQWVEPSTVAPSGALNSYVRVYVAGITDRTAGTDASARLTVAVGVGPDGALPADGAFPWTGAAPNAGWDAAAGGEPNNDEYEAPLTAPATAGLYDVAARVVLDGTRTLYCDTKTSPESDGSADGYQPANAWGLTVE